MASLIAMIPFALAVSVSAFQSFASYDVSDPWTACQTLKYTYPDITYLPEDEGYMNENQVSWDSSGWLGPACIFAPTCANSLSFAVKIFVATHTKFAMRGGGHMPISDAANINSTGILISSTNLNTLQLSEDGETMSIGPGPRWGDVFNYLESTNKTVIGGRLSPVGVPGLLLGGGISWYSVKHGLASSEGKIKAYEAVLADGTIATITANNAYSDLYWALGGGANSFALITRFDLQTFPSITPLIADAHYGSTTETRDAYFAAILNMALTNEEDLASTIIPVCRWGPGSTMPSYESTLFHNGTTAPISGPLAEFIHGNITGLTALNATAIMRPVSLAQYGSAMRSAFEEGGQSHGLRQKFHVVSMKATAENLAIVHDTFFNSLAASGLADKVPEFFAGLDFNIVNREMVERSAGLPQNIPLEPAFWVVEATSWESGGEFDHEVAEWVKGINVEIERKLEVVDGLNRYIYLNDADKDQKVFESYGSESIKRLRTVRAKYDPERVFTDLMPGGWKVEHATS
ncbi:FAD-binding domain-containing protein [Stemphylium lycopersici]|uniref:FAD-binding domain-containing protein n=1 Tax=Stemphylium lycopersici TaxID=183478 RepID=A0A364MZL9_STELY|nr:fad binding domain-containing protein [Stemphylium lycopersici]RAQ98728.1 FAD-binding domain-containing protein [Stemphylium lycopersici]RAR08038.1 FAD-binding domain-containing protein [Stemphylium lycopersici]